jgi:hypothetical protein
VTNDLKYTEDGDLLIENGQVFFADATQHHASNVVTLDKWDDKFNPLLGCNITDYINGLTPREVIARNIRTELKKVGITAKSVVIGDTIEVQNAKYQ